MPFKAKRQAEKRKQPIFYVFGVTRSGIEPRPPAPRADAVTAMLREGGLNVAELVTMCYLAMAEIPVQISTVTECHNTSSILNKNDMKHVLRVP